MPKTHYKMSPSAAKRWLNCPGSLKAADGVESKSSEWADEGTRAHDLAEEALKKDLDAKDLTEDSETAGAVQEYLDAIRMVKRTRKVLFEAIEETVQHPSIKGLGGTPDHVLLYVEDGKVVLHLHDYKHGAGLVVEAKENEQLLTYLVILDTILLGLAETFRVTIVQPRISNGDSVDTWETDLDRVERFADQIAAVGGQDHLHAGDWCRWCPVLLSCKEVQKHTQEVARKEFGLIAGDTEKLVEFMRLAPAIKAFLDKVPTALLQKAKAGERIPGYKVIERMSNRKWNEDLDIEDELSQLGVEEEEYTTKTLRTPPQLEKVLKGRGVSLKHLIVRKSIGHAVVPESARGKAVEIVEFPELRKIQKDG